MMIFVLIITFFVLMSILFFANPTTKGKRKSSVRKIYKTTDGYFTQNEKIKKPRRVAVVKQRKDDGAVAVSKIYSKGEKTGKYYIKNVTLKPENHQSLTEDSAVDQNIIVGTKGKDGQYKAIYPRDLDDTGDKLTKKEHRAIMKGAGGENKQHKKTLKKRLKQWENHFKRGKK